MEASLLAVTILWSFLYIYSMLGSMDFGAGFWGMVYSNNERNTSAAVIANRFLSPTWEVTNVFLVLFVVATVSFFPFATEILGAVLLVPMGLGLILLTIRTTFMVYAHSVEKFRTLLRVISGITGVLIPAMLVSILPLTLGGFVTYENGNPQLLYEEFLTSFTLYSHILFGFFTELFLSAMFLADYAYQAHDKRAYNIYRRHAIWLGPVTILTALITIFTLGSEAGWFVANVREQVFGFSMSFIMFVAGYTALFLKDRKNNKTGYPRYSVVLVILQYGFAIYAYGSAHLPYMIYPHMTIQDGFTNPTIFYSLLIVYGVGLALLVPAFYLFWRLFLKDERYLQQEK